MADTRVTLAALRAVIHRFHSDRGWHRFHNAKDLSLSLSLEANELLELFQWRGEAEVAYIESDSAWRKVIADELADVVIYALTLANRVDIDLSDAVLAKIARNKERFPPGAVPPRVEDGPPPLSGVSRKEK